MLGTVALIRKLGLAPRHLMVLALMSQTLTPWGGPAGGPSAAGLRRTGWRPFVVGFGAAALVGRDVIAGIAARVPIADISVREPEMEGIIREIYEAREVRR